MHTQIIGSIAGHHAMMSDAHSALPDAPVIVERERSPRAAPARSTLARGLHRLADVVAPAIAAPTAACH